MLVLRVTTKQIYYLLTDAQSIKQDNSFLQSHTIKIYNRDQSTSHEDGKAYKKQSNKSQVSIARDWAVTWYSRYH